MNTGDMAFVIRKDQTLDSRSEVESASVFNNSVNSPLTSTKTVILSAGTYYITVTNKTGTLYGASKTPEYKVKTTYESFGFKETPDSYDLPKSMIIGNTYTDALTATDKEDWYKVSIPENGKYTLNYSSVQSRVDFRLKDMNLKEVAGKDCFEHENKTEDAFLEAGTYYLHVNGWASKYSVSFNKAKIGNASISKVKAARKKKVKVK